MKSRICFALVLAAALLLTTAPTRGQVSSTAMHSGLLHELSTDASIYVMHEPVSIDYSVTNESTGDVWLEYPCQNRPLALKVLDPYGQPVWIFPGCIDSIWWDLFEVGESYVLQEQWDMVDDFTGEPISEAGIYTVQGILSTYTEPYFYVLSLEITIVDAETLVPEQQAVTWSLIKALYR